MEYKKKEIKLICNSCGEEPKEDKSKSSENWKAYDASCECGGRLIIKL